MRKVTALILSAILCMSLLCACGRRTDSNGNTLITSNWTIVEYTVNGQREDLRDDSFLLKLLMFRDKPRFKCNDGTNFEISLLQKSRSGTVTQRDDGIYELYVETGSDPLYASIVGNELTIYDDQGRIEMVFETS